MRSLRHCGGNGLIDRRTLLGRSMFFAGAMGTGVGPFGAKHRYSISSLARASVVQ
jgi:hypothetical protein